MRPLEPLAVDDEVDALVVEAEQTGDAFGLGDRRLVAPHEVVVDLVVELDGPVRRLAFERADGLGVRGAEQIRTDVLAGGSSGSGAQVSSRSTGLVGLGDLDAVDGDLDVGSA